MLILNRWRLEDIKQSKCKGFIAISILEDNSDKGDGFFDSNK
tara:strand:- start:376 stop:501 length:126 start_codon:yes stop_codon:yes gene_type:complete